MHAHARPLCHNATVVASHECAAVNVRSFAGVYAVASLHAQHAHLDITRTGKGKGLA